jgi:hypothetical protein
MRFAPAVAALALSMLLPLAGCGDSTGSGTGRLSIHLKDAPGDVKHAVVTISEIYLQGSGRVVLMDEPVTVDLLTLANSTAELVKDAVVPSGSYAQLRFVVTGGYIEVENAGGGTSIYASSPTYEGLPQGAHVDGHLQMPSLAQSGLKVKLPGGSVKIAGDEQILLVDFNVARSFGKQAGNSGMWVMEPVLEATDFLATGGVTVTLQKDAAATMPVVNGAPLTLGDFKAVLSTADGPQGELALTDDDHDGTYEARFLFLAPGSYTVDLEAPDGVTFTTTPSRPVTVTVTSGKMGSVEFKLTDVK